MGGSPSKGRAHARRRRPSLTAKKPRALELRAGMPYRKGKKRNAAAYSLKDVRARELALS
jgi:hypothetical protein